MQVRLHETADRALANERTATERTTVMSHQPGPSPEPFAPPTEPPDQGQPTTAPTTTTAPPDTLPLTGPPQVAAASLVTGLALAVVGVVLVARMRRRREHTR
jgi:LPXTG-motif cell wall-anchored protein